MNIDPQAFSFDRFSPEEQALLLALRKWYLAAYQPLNAFFQSEFRALEYLLEHGRVYAGDLAKPLGVTKQRVTALLASLEKKGLVALSPDERDRRRVTVELTEAGFQHFIEKSRTLSDALQYMFERLGPDGVKNITEALNKLIPTGDEHHEA